jgi:hypothetical protein
MPVSTEALRLARKVEQLPTEDQDKILRIVDLLTLVPEPVQDQAWCMLRELLAREPRTRLECLVGVAEVIAHLERHARGPSRVA